MSVPAQTSDCAALNLYIYLGDDKARDGESINQILKRLETDSRQFLSDKKSNEFRDNYNALRDAVKNNPDLGDMTISGQSRNMPGYEDVHACVFTSPEGDAYVTFRGTGDGRWVDNGEGFGPNDSDVQVKSAEYFDRVAAQHGWDKDTNLVVTGHSKGGNLSQYITMASDRRDIIDSCISIDGQGFSPEAIERFRKMKGYEDQRDKLHSVSGNNDPVNQLGIRLVKEDNIYYLDQSDVDGSNPFNYHTLTSKFKNGKLREQADGPGSTGRLFADLSVYIMSLDPKNREEIAISIMQAVEVILGEMSKSTSYAEVSDFSALLSHGLPGALQIFLIHNIDDALRNADSIPDYLKIGFFFTSLGLATVLSFFGECAEFVIDITFDKIEKIFEFASRIIDSILDTELGQAIAQTLSTILSELYQIARTIFETVKNWVNNNLNYGYKSAVDASWFLIDTSAYWELGKRVEHLQKIAKQIEDLLDSVYWYNTSLTLEEYHYVGNANRRVGGTFKLGQCASYFFATAEDFEKVEEQFS